MRQRLWRETGPVATRKFSYDYTGRVTAESVVASGATYRVLYSWDNNGNLTKLTYPSGREVNYTYDLADRVNKVTAKMGTTTTTVLDSTFYLPFGPDSSMKLGNGIKVRRKFDKRYYADSIKSTTAGIFGRSYRYDHNGNISGLVDLIDNTKSYDTLKYDGLDRLLVAKRNNRSDSLRFTYQKNGNRLTKKKNVSTTDYSYLNNRLRNTTGTEVVNYGYNANGSIIGDTLSGQTKVYFYDKLNRIVKITGIAPTDSFAYDAENKRVYKNEQGVVRNNIYDIYGNLIEEANLGPWAIDYIWANGEPRARVDNPETEGFAPLVPQTEAYWWYHTDHLGTPYVLTDKDKVVVWKISLDPFGETVSETAPLTLDNLRFPGQYADRGSGLNYNWNRYYQPKIGRYYQTDPVLSQNLSNGWKIPAMWLAGQENFYAYTESNPVNETDRFGLFSLRDIEKNLEERAVQLLAQGENLNAFIAITGASAACFAECMLWPSVREGSGKLITPYAGGGAARAWYHFTDKRFKAWGRTSKVLVPKLGAKLASGISIVGWGLLAHETYACIKKCQDPSDTDKGLCKK